MDHVSIHGLSYNTQEEFLFRQTIFQKADEEIERINSNQNNTFTVAHNEFSTWTDDELKLLGGYSQD